MRPASPPLPPRRPPPPQRGHASSGGRELGAQAALGPVREASEKRGSGRAELPAAPGSLLARAPVRPLHGAALRSRSPPPPPAPGFIAAARAAGALAPPRAQAPSHQPARPPFPPAPPPPTPARAPAGARRSEKAPQPPGGGAGSAIVAQRTGKIPRALPASWRRRPRRRERERRELCACPGDVEMGFGALNPSHLLVCLCVCV